ncbi:DUF72 domain-containing protein [Enterococcus bulliens]
MIYIGCTGFEEHQTLSQKSKTSLTEYASHFPIVELDTSFYFIPTKQAVAKWLRETPAAFRFILKVPGVFTTHRKLEAEESLLTLAKRFLEHIEPLRQSGRLFCLLAQFPARFTCTNEHVLYLEEIKKIFATLPLAIEFRHRSWYDERYTQQMYRFMYANQLSLALVDEPKKLPTTIPLDATITNQEFTLLRLHGRNDAGWMHTGVDARKFRTLYRYSAEELHEFAELIRACQQKTKEIAVIFNNNSGGDAAENAQQLIQQLQITYQELNPTQLDLF